MSLKILKYRFQEASSDGTDPGAGASSSPSAEKWESMAENFDQDEDSSWEGDLDAGTAEESLSSDPAQTVTPPVEPKPTDPLSAQQPPVAPPEPPKAQEPTAVTPPPEPQPPAESPVDLTAQRSTLRNTLVQRYALNEEMAEKALTDPGSVLPELAADLQLNVTEAVTYGIMSILPQILEQHLKQREVTTQSEQAFFGRWKDLDSPRGRQAVQQFGQAYRQLNPTAPAQEFIEKVGAAAMLSLGLNPGGAVPAANSSVESVAPPPPPAAPGGATPLPRAPASSNKFAVLAEELLTDTDD
jgi:hypothetical protein